MDFTKRFSFFGIYVYVSSHRLKRRGRREDYYRKHPLKSEFREMKKIDKQTT